MRDTFTHLAGQTGRLRSELNHLMSLVERLESLTTNPVYMAPETHDTLIQKSETSAGDATKQLEYVADVLQHWHATISDAKSNYMVERR